MQQNFREQVVYQQINTIRQLTSRLRQSEQRNAQLLEQLNQAETYAAQELGRLDQLLSQLESQISQISPRSEMQTYGQPGYTQPNYGQSPFGPGNPSYNPSQYGSSYSSQYGANPTQPEQRK
jgi:hypothetical protein